MAIIDGENLLEGTKASGGLLTGVAVTTARISGNVIDTNPGKVAPNTLRNLGSDGDVKLVVLCTADMTSGTVGSTITFTLQSDSTADLATAPVSHITIGPTVKTSMVAGTQFIIPLPIGQVYKRYLGLSYTMSATLITGKFAAYIVQGLGPVQTYAANYTIS